MENCIFCKIAKGEIKAKIVYEDEKFIAFRDANPQAPDHILIIPKKHIKNLHHITDDDSKISHEILKMAKEIAKEIKDKNNLLNDLAFGELRLSK